MPLIALEAVTYRYPEAEQPALVEVSAAIEPGQVVLLRGASGSGKSTLLRCLNGLVPHSTGGEVPGRVIACGPYTRTPKAGQLWAPLGFLLQHPVPQVACGVSHA